MYIYIYICLSLCLSLLPHIYIYIYRDPASITGNHLSNATCLTQVLFKRCKY